MATRNFVVEFAASGSGADVPRVRAYHFAGNKAEFLNSLKRILQSTLKWSVLSRALTGINDQCLMYTNQFITSKAHRFA